MQRQAVPLIRPGSPIGWNWNGKKRCPRFRTRNNCAANGVVKEVDAQHIKVQYDIKGKKLKKTMNCRLLLGQTNIRAFIKNQL